VLNIEYVYIAIWVLYFSLHICIYIFSLTDLIVTRGTLIRMGARFENLEPTLVTK